MDSTNRGYYFVFDTNFIRKNDKDIETFDEFALHRFDKLIEFLNSYHLTDKIKLLLPEIVILELTHQKKSKLTSWIKAIKDYSENFSQIKDFLNKLPEIDVDAHIEKLREEKIKDLEIITIPDDKKRLFEEILIRCVEKKSPFIEGDSDRGFKDAILFLSVLDYANNFSDSVFVLFSKDKAFSDEDCSSKLIEEFSETGNIFKIVKNYDVEGFIRQEFKIDIEFMDYINEQILPEIEENISNFRRIKINDRILPILNLEIDPNSTFQEEIEPEKVKVVITFKIDYLEDEIKKELTDFTVELLLSKSEKKVLEQKPYNYEVIESDSE